MRDTRPSVNTTTESPAAPAPGGADRRLVVTVLIVLGAVLAATRPDRRSRQPATSSTGRRSPTTVDDIRRDDEVASLVGRSISDQLVIANPDLVALRPLVESVATRVAGGDVLSGPTRLAANTAHTALTEGDADSVVLRLADAGAVVAAALGAIAPERAPRAADVSVTLANIGSQDFASTTVAIASAVGVLAWLLPLLALVCFVRRGRALAVALAGDGSGRLGPGVGRGGSGCAARDRRRARPAPRRRRARRRGGPGGVAGAGPPDVVARGPGGGRRDHGRAGVHVERAGHDGPPRRRALVRARRGADRSGRPASSSGRSSPSSSGSPRSPTRSGCSSR